MIVVHHDFTSPASAVTVLRLQRLADAGGAVTFSGTDMLGTSIAVPPTLDLLAGLRRWSNEAASFGLVMRRPSRQPPTLSTHLITPLAEEAGLGASWRWRVLTAYWQTDEDIADHAALVELAVEVGLDRGHVLAQLADEPARRALASRMATRRRNGVGGVPMLEFDGTLLSADLADEDLRSLASL